MWVLGWEQEFWWTVLGEWGGVLGHQASETTWKLREAVVKQAPEGPG